MPLNAYCTSVSSLLLQMSRPMVGVCLGVGLQGQSYAIPTMQGGVGTIAPYVDEFIEYALFTGAVSLGNVSLPRRFWDNLESDVSDHDK